MTMKSSSKSLRKKKRPAYAYRGMVPAFYSQALRKAIEDIKECKDCAAETERMAKEVKQHEAE